MAVTTAAPTRITFMVNDLTRAGAEMQMVLLALELKRRGHEVGIVSILPFVGSVDDLRSAGIPVATLVPGPAFAPGTPIPKRAVLRGVRPGLRLLHRWRTTALVCFIHEASLVGRVLGRLAGVPLVIGSERSVWREGAVDRHVTRLTDRWLGGTVVNAQRLADDLVAAGVVPPNRVHVIPNGIDVDAFVHDEQTRGRRRAELGLGDDFAWFAVGRLMPEKDHQTLLHALADVRAVDPRARLVVVGRGALREHLEAQARQLGLASCVTFLGHRTDVPELLAAADGLVLSSQYEGLPNAVLEACAAGLPVVSTAVGAVDELVRDGVNGWLVPPQRPPELAAGMLRVMAAQPPQRRAMAAASRAAVRERYGVEQIATAWEDLIASLLEAVATRGSRRPARLTGRRDHDRPVLQQ